MRKYIRQMSPSDILRFGAITYIILFLPYLIIFVTSHLTLGGAPPIWWSVFNVLPGLLIGTILEIAKARKIVRQPAPTPESRAQAIAAAAAETVGHDILDNAPRLDKKLLALRDGDSKMHFLHKHGIDVNTMSLSETTLFENAYQMQCEQIEINPHEQT